MHILQLSEAQIAALNQATGGMGVYVTTQWNTRTTIIRHGIAVKIPRQLRQTLLTQRIAFGLFRIKILQQHIDRIDGGHTVPLSHQPAAGDTGQAIGNHIARIGRHHIQGTAGMPLWVGFKVVCIECAAVEIHFVGVGHMHHQPHGRSRQAVSGR